MGDRVNEIILIIVTLYPLGRAGRRALEAIGDRNQQQEREHSERELFHCDGVNNTELNSVLPRTKEYEKYRVFHDNCPRCPRDVTTSTTRSNVSQEFLQQKMFVNICTESEHLMKIAQKRL